MKVDAGVHKVPTIATFGSWERADQEARLAALIAAIRTETDVLRRLSYIQERLNLERALALHDDAPPPRHRKHATHKRLH